jgi:segregation and condensation protein A
VRLESFEGPLDLLLYLIQSHEMDITRISISKITDQYLSYVKLMQELNFDVASDFLVMAATLLQWKSKSLLPQEGTAADQAAAGDIALSQEELIRQLLLHKLFRQAAVDMDEGFNRLHEDVFTRPNKRPPTEKVWREMDITSLALSYQDMVVRARRRKQILKKETVSLSGKILEFKERLAIGKLTELNALLSADPSRAEVVVTFLASLELSRLKKMRIHQEEAYQAIYVELLESLEAFDTKLASGFDPINDQMAGKIQGMEGDIALAHAAAAGINRPIESQAPTQQL